MPNQNIPLVTKSKPGKKQAFLDPSELQDTILQADKDFYNRSDNFWNELYPSLGPGRQASLESVEAPLQGRGDPFLQNQLQKSGLGDLSFGKDEVTMGRNLGEKNILDKENRDRDYFSRFVNTNRPRQFGLTSKEIGEIADVNAGESLQNALSLSQNYGPTVQAAIAQQGQNVKAITSGITTGLNTLGNVLNPSSYGSPYTSGGFYGGGGGALGSALSNFHFGNTSSSPNYNPDMGETVPLSSGGNW